MAGGAWNYIINVPTTLWFCDSMTHWKCSHTERWKSYTTTVIKQRKLFSSSCFLTWKGLEEASELLPLKLLVLCSSLSQSYISPLLTHPFLISLLLPLSQWSHSKFKRDVFPALLLPKVPSQGAKDNSCCHHQTFPSTLAEPVAVPLTSLSL